MSALMNAACLRMKLGDKEKALTHLERAPGECSAASPSLLISEFPRSKLTRLPGSSGIEARMRLIR
jgi:hypothetical protein